MKWRDRVITEVAKKLHARWAKNFPDSVSADWEASNRASFIRQAEETIVDVRDGAKKAGWTLEFTQSVPDGQASDRK